jgi:hypothetical protein
MEEFFLVILIGMVVYVPVGVLGAFFIWAHESATMHGAFESIKAWMLPADFQDFGRRLLAFFVVAILFGVSPWLMVDYFQLGMILFVTSVLVLAVMRGLTPLPQH